MRCVIQRVSKASVTSEGKPAGQIEKGLMVLVGVKNGDTEKDVKYMADKVPNLRIFEDEQEKMNLSVKDIDGQVMVVSQFTLFASTAKGNRPSYIKAAKPDVAVPLYEKFLAVLGLCLQKSVERGIFGADMKVELLNDGPVTIIVDSKLKF